MGGGEGDDGGGSEGDGGGGGGFEGECRGVRPLAGEGARAREGGGGGCDGGGGATLFRQCSWKEQQKTRPVMLTPSLDLVVIIIDSNKNRNWSKRAALAADNDRGHNSTRKTIGKYGTSNSPTGLFIFVVLA